MHDTITITHNLASFSVTEEPKPVETEGKMRFTITSGAMESEVKRHCDRCGGVMHVHQCHTVRIQHVALMARPHLLSVTYVRTRCTGCGYITSQDLLCFVKYVYNKKSPKFQFLISWKSTI